MAANDYHGYNDIVAVWADPDAHEGYVPDETYRRQYFGEMTGPDAEAAEAAIKAYRSADSVEVTRRRNKAADARAGVQQAMWDKAWESAWHIASNGASNPKGVRYTLDELVAKGMGDSVPARAIQGHLDYLEGRSPGPELDDLREVDANARRLGIIDEHGKYVPVSQRTTCQGCGCQS